MTQSNLCIDHLLQKSQQSHTENSSLFLFVACLLLRVHNVDMIYFDAYPCTYTHTHTHAHTHTHSHTPASSANFWGTRWSGATKLSFLLCSSNSLSNSLFFFFFSASVVDMPPPEKSGNRAISVCSSSILAFRCEVREYSLAISSSSVHACVCSPFKSVMTCNSLTSACESDSCSERMRTRAAESSVGTDKRATCVCCETRQTHYGFEGASARQFYPVSIGSEKERRAIEEVKYGQGRRN